MAAASAAERTEAVRDIILAKGSPLERFIGREGETASAALRRAPLEHLVAFWGWLKAEGYAATERELVRARVLTAGEVSDPDEGARVGPAVILLMDEGSARTFGALIGERVQIWVRRAPL